MSETIADAYRGLVASGGIVPDPAQQAVLPMLEDLRHHLETTRLRRRGVLGGLFHRPDEVPEGLYLWGGVGRGKSMLMDMFVAHVDIEEKRRVHFHGFMQEVQAGIHAAREEGAQDAIAPVAACLAEGLRLLALDEMQITDIADAMIVGRLFEKLFAAGVVVVTTSNRPPAGLYENGLNRQLFLPFIELLEARLVVHELASPKDYRRDMLAGTQRYFAPLDRAARAGIEAIWEGFAAAGAAPLRLDVKGREVVLPAYASGVARATFHDLCTLPHGPADFLAIAERVRMLIVENIPQLGRANFNEARRFVVLIDALYEAHVKLVASAAAAPEYLYVEGEGSFEFERTASRLREMQAEGWGS